MMSHNQDKEFFSGGLESASSIVASGILTSSWKLIFDLNAETHNNSNQNLFWKKVSNDSGLTIITFGTAQNHFQPKLLPFPIDKYDNLFKFICSKTNPIFSLNEYVFSLFNAHLTQLLQLKSEIDLKRPVIVTGHGVGGSIASLFTLLLLEKMDPTKDKRPLCITFGSPLIADQNFHQAMSQGSDWNSCFLHVASLQDPFLIFSSSLPNNSYSPFGIFLLCSDYGSSCFENPVFVLRLLNLMSQLNHQGLQNCDYGRILDNLNRKAICRDANGSNILHSDLFQESLALQLCALGFPQLLQEIDLENLVKDLKQQEVLKRRKKRFIPNKRLDDMKINMANLEWYKKVSKKEGTGYYDRFKADLKKSDNDVKGFIKELNIYWEEMVKEVEKQPQKEGASFRTRWLYAGTNYRRMVEPLDIANYYKEGKRDYINQGRHDQYKQLEKWLNNDQRADQSRISVTKNVESILTLDSCFWAHVEEAHISCRKIKAVRSGEVEKREAIMNGLDAFEEYV